MESLFDYNSEDTYSLTEFFWKFKDKLPLIVIVTKGEDNTTIWDDLGTGQVIRFNKGYTEKRALAKRSDFSLQMQFLSIPLDTMYTYHIVKGKDKVETARSLPDILNTHDLPVLIQFSDTPDLPYLAKNDDGTMTNLLVTHTYENHYLVGNTIDSDEGVIDSSTIVSNICKSVTVSPVLGFTDDGQEYFQEYLESLDKFVKNKVTQKDYDISIKTYNIMDKEIKGIVDMSEVTGNDIYDEICPPLPERTYRPPPVPQRKPILDEAHCLDELSRREKHKSDCYDKEQCSPHEKHTTFQWNLHKNSIKSKVSGAFQGFREKINSVKKEHWFTNPETSRSSRSMHPTEYVETAVRQSDSHCYSSLKFDKKSHISSLTIMEVGEVLKKLNLTKYVDKFCQNQVDGFLLRDIDITILTNDFGFTQPEAETLMTYVSDSFTCKNDFQD